MKIENITFLRTLQHITQHITEKGCKNGCKWRAIPKHFGQCDTIDRRFRRQIDAGAFDRIETSLQTQVIDRKGLTSLAMDSTYVEVHPDGTGPPSKKGRNLSAKAAAGGRRKSTPP